MKLAFECCEAFEFRKFIFSGKGLVSGSAVGITLKYKLNKYLHIWIVLLAVWNAQEAVYFSSIFCLNKIDISEGHIDCKVDKLQPMNFLTSLANFESLRASRESFASCRSPVQA